MSIHDVLEEKNMEMKRKKIMDRAKSRKRGSIQDVAYQKQKEKEIQRIESLPAHDKKFEEKELNEKIEKLKDEIAEYLTNSHSNILKGSMFDLKVRNKLRPIINNYIINNKIVIIGYNDETLTDYMLNEIAGLGPIDEIIAKGEGKISEVWANGENPITGEVDIYYEKGGRKYKETNIKFRSPEHAYDIAKKIARNGNQAWGDNKPIANVRYPDGRVNLVRTPIATGGGGPYISFRLFPEDTLLPADLVRLGVLSEEMDRFLGLAFKHKLNGLIGGPTGSGKTTTFTAYVSKISDTDRILLMEDTEEMRIRHKYPHKHIITEECKYNTQDENSNYDFAKLTVNYLRQKPDYALYGEIRDKSAYDVLNGANTGHCVWTSIHIRSADKAPQRLINMILEHGSKMDTESIGKWVSEAIDIIVFQKLYSDNVRRIKEIIELVDYKDGKPVFNTLYKFIIEGKDEDGRIIGKHHRVGRISRELAELLIDSGADLEEIIPFIEKPKEIPSESIASKIAKYYEDDEEVSNKVAI